MNSRSTPQSKFSPTKRHKLVLYLLKNWGKEDIDLPEFNALLYLLDVAYYQLFGDTFSSYKYKYGNPVPIAYGLKSDLRELKGNEIKLRKDKNKWKISVSDKRRHRFVPKFTSYERILINKFITELKDEGYASVKRIANSTRPVQRYTSVKGRRPKYLSLDSVKRSEIMKKWIKNNPDKVPPSRL